MRLDMAAPTISIIVPVYNVEKYLPRCIDSILAQTFRDFELILVDDGSPDNCPALCDAAAEKDPRVVVLHQKNGGLSAARNAGLEIARGEWVGFVDSDDYIAPEMYETLYHTAISRGGGVQLVICSYTYVDEEDNTLPRESPIKQEKVLDRIEAMDLLGGDRSWYYITAWNKLYAKKLFDTVRFPVGKLHEDEYVVHELFWQCEKIAIVPQALYFYVQRNGSIMRQKSIKRYLDGVDGTFRRMKFACEHGLNRLAFRSCNGVLGLLSSLKCEGLLEESGEEELYEQTLQEIRPKLYSLLKIPRYEEYKLAILAFLLSPRLFYLLLQWKIKLKDLLRKKGKA